MANFVAEIGINHGGSLEAAKAYIEAIDADFVKFQKLDPDSYIPIGARDEPHPVPENAYGPTYYAHKQALEFTVEQHIELRDFAARLGKQYALSVFDMKSLEDAVKIGPVFLKIPSCRARDLALVNKAKEWFPKRVQISTGMMDATERSRIRTANRDCVIYATNSDYTGRDPVPIPPATDYNGLSIHRPDPSYGIIGTVKGYEWIEYHVTADRKAKGTDHKISLEIPEWNAMVKTCRGIMAAQTVNKMPSQVSENEMFYRRKLCQI